MEIIRLEQIAFSYGPVQALCDVSLNLEEGVFGLLGPNGAGKTTLIKVLLGFLKPAAGSGNILGTSLANESKHFRFDIGYMPESDSLIPGLDAVSLTAYLGELSGMPRNEAIKRAHEVLYYVGLDESRYRQVHTYSTGMKQRLKLAQALVHDPQLLLLDEPTSGMDPQGRKDMLELIHDISRKRSMSIIISSHLLADVESTCEQALIMAKGRIIARETIAHIDRAEYTPLEIKVTGEESRFFAALESRQWRIEAGERGLWRIFLPRHEPTGILFRLALDCGVQIRHFRQSRTTLEDVFMRALGENDDH